MSRSSTLSVAIVCYRPDISLLSKTIESVNAAIGYAQDRGELGETALWLIDNGPHQEGETTDITSLLRGERVQLNGVPVEVIRCEENLGYGRGHNLAIRRTSKDYHLILNPDVILAEDALSQALAFMGAHSDVGLLAPAVTGEDGAPHYLCKRYPAVFDLLLRGFAPRAVQRLFRKRLAYYEMRDVLNTATALDVPMVSGSFMFFRRPVLSKLGGFTDDLFLYFEDFDLSQRTREIARTAYVPAVRIRHFGGNAAKKGMAHVWMFIKSAFIFYNKHGWRWW
ncbi:MAG: glycosyltransferase [Gammaproteobacteria bacterium]|nr:glycosyltransferase [Gammaproteobacteria bacterium]